jgi:II/X family phage/plasmid replication protein
MASSCLGSPLVLDWFTGCVGYDASRMEVGRFWETDRHGEIVRSRSRWETAVGSFESGVQVTRALATDAMLGPGRDLGFLCAQDVLKISGNPSKFLQGHNAAGPSVSQLGPVLQGLVRAFGEGLRPADADLPTLPAVHRSRVDVTTACDLGDHRAVHEWLELAATKTRSRHGRAINSHGTVYWGKNSTRWAMKAYCKHCELQAHPPADVELIPDLLDWTRTHLRIELTLRRPELKDRGTLSEAIIWEFFSKLEMHTMQQKTYAPENLRPFVRLALESWYNGGDLKSTLADRTFYKYRKEILEETGIDVLMPRAAQSASAAPALLGLDELQRREVKDVPARIQRSLFGAGV